MQSTASSTLAQSDILKAMQPQPAQNMYVPSSGANNTGNVRTNQQTAGMFRAPPASPAPRSGTRHVSMPMYQQMHQGVQSVVLPYQYPPRQPQFQAPQFQFSQPMQTGYYPYHYFQPLQPPQPHQRSAVGVNAGVNVGVTNTMTVQAGPNGPMTAPPGATQAQMPITSGTVIASTPGTNPVLGVATPTAAQQVGVPPIVGVVPAVAAQPTQTSRRRKYALDIIDPNTNKNIMEDYDLAKSSSTSEVEFSEQVSVPSIQPEIPMGTPQQDPSALSIGVIVMGPEIRPSLPYNIDAHQISQRDAIAGQTPVVSAMSDAPSVEILPTPLKSRAKKILSIVPPKEDQNVAQTQSHTTETNRSKNIDESVKSDCVQPLNPEQYSNTQVPLVNVQPQQQQNPSASTVSRSSTATTTSTVAIGDSNISKEPATITTSTEAENSVAASTVTTVITSTTTSDWSHQETVLNSSSSNKNSNIVNVSSPASSDHSQNTISSSANASISYSNSSKSSNQQQNISRTVDSNRAQHTMQITENETTKSNNEEERTPTSAKTTGTTTTSNGVISDKSPVSENETRNETQNNNIVDTSASNISNTNNNRAVNQPDETNANTISAVPKDLNTDSAQTVATCDETDRALSNSPNTIDDNELANKEARKNLATDNSSEEIVSEKVLPSTETSTVKENTLSTPANTLSTTVQLTASTQQKLQPPTQSPLINYNEGQWSPINPTGKKQYDREQLMLLRDAKASRIQPEVNNVSILPQPNLMPSFVRDKNKRVQSMVGSIGSGNRGGGDGGGGGNYAGGNKGSMSGRNSSMKGMIRVNLSLNQDVKLNETDNAWRPRVLVKGGEGEDPDEKSKREKDELIRRVRGILNKLTPEKFDTLVEEIIKLKIDTPDKMEEVMVLVFEKAIDEPNFSISYARLCHRLITEVKARDERMESGTKTNLAHFRNALLDKTEREFTHNVTQSSAKEKKLQPIIDRIANCTDPSEKAELEAQLEEEERKIRRRSGGTVRFIGELFKISMLTGKIIHSCIEALLNPNSEDMLECMCKLLTTVGARYEQTPRIPKEPHRYYTLDSTIQRMQAIASKTDKDGAKVSSRVRFMLQDVIDLRKNKWQSTRNEAPKTMEQIEKEAKTEQLSAQYLNYNSSVSGGGGSGGANGSSMNSGKREDRGGRYSDSRSGGYGGSHSQRGDTGSLRRQQQDRGGGNSSMSGGHSNGNNDDTWHVQTGKGGRSLTVDANKLEGLISQNFDIGKKMGGLSQFQWNNSISKQSPAPTTTASNSFAALSSLQDSMKSNDRDRDRSGPRNKGSYNKGSLERDRYSDRGMHTRTGSSQTSRENSSSRGSQGMRGMMNTSSMQKSASHSKYSQPTNRLMPKPTIPSMSGSSSFFGRTDQSSSGTYSNTHPSDSSYVNPNAPPTAVFEKLSDNDMKTIKTVVSEMSEIDPYSKNVDSLIGPCINRVKETQRCGLLYYILSDHLHLRQVGQTQRRHLANVTVLLIKQNYMSVEHFRLAYKNFCEIATDLIYDIPELWLYIFEFTGPLITNKILTINDLWTKQLKDLDTPRLGEKFLKTYLSYCSREIGPNFTRYMWKNFAMKWTDFIPQSEIRKFIQSNKFEFVEDELVQPEIHVRERKDEHITRIVEHVEQLLKEGSTAECIIDYINGNIVDIDKQFIKCMTTKLCNFATPYVGSGYKLNMECFQKMCIPVLQKYIDSKPDRELECLYSMQLFVHSLEHPRGLLCEMYGELYDADIIPQDSFIKWRDSKDQSAGKGVAVKGLNPFFNHVLNSETSDENN